MKHITKYLDSWYGGYHNINTGTIFGYADMRLLLAPELRTAFEAYGKEKTPATTLALLKVMLSLPHLYATDDYYSFFPMMKRLEQANLLLEANFERIDKIEATRGLKSFIESITKASYIFTFILLQSIAKDDLFRIIGMEESLNSSSLKPPYVPSVDNEKITEPVITIANHYSKLLLERIFYTLEFPTEEADFYYPKEKRLYPEITKCLAEESNKIVKHLPPLSAEERKELKEQGYAGFDINEVQYFAFDNDISTRLWLAALFEYQPGEKKFAMSSSPHGIFAQPSPKLEPQTSPKPELQAESNEVEESFRL